MFGKRKQAKLDEYANRPLMSSNVTDFMEKLGLSEEEIAEMAKPASTIDQVQAKIDEGDVALDIFVGQAKATWSNHASRLVDLQPFHMLPLSLWNDLATSDRALLVEVIGLVPGNPWNIVLLAADEDTATLTGAARFPLSLSEEAAVAIEMAKLTIAAELEAIKTVDQTQVDAFVTTRDAAAARIIALARPIGAAALGDTTVNHSRATFFGD